MKKFYKQMIVGAVLLATAVACFLILRSTYSFALKREIQSWMGYQMSFPEEVRLISGDSSLLSRPYKILMYIDDKGCTSCSLKLQAWSNMYETELNIIAPDKLSIIILFEGAIKEDILIHVQSANWEMPVLWDRDGVVNKQHKFPKRPGMRCMLLDNSNNVVLVGNPVSSRGIYELYLKFLLNLNN